MSDCWQGVGRQFPVLLLIGPRQVGKTTLLRHLCQDGRTYVSLDDPALRALAQEDPALFLQRFAPPVLIDEIQYAPQLLPLIKIAADRADRPGLFWLTGSQRFHMMKNVSESLAGRVAILNLLGLSQRERRRGDLSAPPFLPSPARSARAAPGEPARLENVYGDIFLGSFPALASGKVTDREVFYSSYLQTYLQRDVKDLAQVGNEAAFVRFLKACAARTGQMLNLTDLARDVDVSVNTAKNWLSILQASFQVVLLPPYHANLSKRLVKTPKLYFLDTGLAAYLTEWSSAATLANGAMAGSMLETFVLSEILKSWWHRGRAPALYYYRDRAGSEVDFLLVQDQALHAVEVKRAAQVRREWVDAFKPVQDLDLPLAAGCVLCLCEQPIPLNDRLLAAPVTMI